MFDRAWIPIMNCNGDVFWAIDLAPPAGGTVGQILEVDWESTSWTVIANSFEAFFEDYVSSQESGSYRIEENGLPTQVEPVE